jgi:hypothetical protein
VIIKDSRRKEAANVRIPSRSRRKQHDSCRQDRVAGNDGGRLVVSKPDALNIFDFM